MESKVQEQTTPKTLSTETPGTLTKSTTTDEPAWQESFDYVMEILAKIPEYIGEFFSEYKQPLTILGLSLLAIITVKIIVAVLGAVDDIPLLAPLLEMVGLGYSAWFVWRYLWKESTRKELLAEFDAIKNQVFGDNA